MSPAQAVALEVSFLSVQWCDPFNYHPTGYSQHICSWVINGVEIHLFHPVGLFLAVTFAVSFTDPYIFHVLKNIR